MKYFSCRAALLLAAGAFALAGPAALHAQATKDTTKAVRDTAKAAHGSVSAAAEIGGGDWDRMQHAAPSEQQLGKLLEYRDIKTGLVIPQAVLMYTPKDSVGTFQILGRNLLQLDQSVWARASMPGSYDAQIRYDGMVHNYSTDARSLGTFGNGNLYALPSPRPDSNAWRAAPYLAPLRSIWDPLKMSLALTPTPSWDTRLEYTHVSKAGDRPIGMAFGGSSNNSREILDPIDQPTQDFKVTQSYSKPHVQGVLSYDYSMFQNEFNSVSSMNPQQIADTKTTGAAIGTTSLAPNNSAQTASAVLAGSLPLRTRIIASGSYSWWRQNEPFLPQTTNSFYTADPNLGVPRASLDGQATTAMFNVSLNSHPLKNLTVSARARSYEYRNQTPPVAIDSFVINDRSLAAGDTSAGKPFSKYNYDVGASYRLLRTLSLNAGLAWETWKRDSTQRNVVTTNERTPRVSLDFTGLDWVTLRASYSNGVRRGDGYHITTASENPDFRRFDEADRNRERTNFEAEFMPIDQLSVALTWEVGHDGYPNSLYGVQSDKSVMAGGSVEWTPTSRFSFNLGYSREDYNDYLQQLYRSGSTAATLHNPTWVWDNNNTDHINTTYAGFTAVLDPDKWEAGGTFSLSDATFLMANFNPLTPTGGTAAQNLSATAINFPAITQQLHPMSFYLRYRYDKDWALTLRYNVESYNQNDYRTQALVPAIGTTANHINLSSYYQNYDVGWWTFLVSWHPSLLKYGMGRSTM
jgi:MtrB/PioB family decaheme-associated outer membrane protein